MHRIRCLIHSANPQDNDKDNCFRICRSFVRPSVSTFQNLANQNKVKTMFATGETVGLAEWIIDGTCPVLLLPTYMCSTFD